MPQEFSRVRGELESAVAEELRNFLKLSSIDSRAVILHFFSIESVRAQSRNSERSILIRRTQDRRLFEEESTLFKSIDEGLKEEWLECYAPVTYRDDHEKRRLLTHMDEFLVHTLESTLASVVSGGPGTEEEENGTARS